MKAGTIMMEWDSRMKNNQGVKVLKAAIPFLDVAIGETINIEGLLGAVRPFVCGKERQVLDVFLQFFQMRRMFDMMQLVQSMQQMQDMAEGFSGADESGGETPGEKAGAGGMPSPEMLSMLKAMVPPDQQDMVDSMMALVSMMQSQPDKQDGGNEEDNEPEPVDF